LDEDGSLTPIPNQNMQLISIEKLKPVQDQIQQSSIPNTNQEFESLAEKYDSLIEQKDSFIDKLKEIGGIISGVTDNKGIFRADNISPGKYLIMLSGDDLPNLPSLYRIYTKHSIPKNSIVKNELVKLNLRRFYLTGNVVDLDGNPASEVKLRTLPKESATQYLDTEYRIPIREVFDKQDDLKYKWGWFTSKTLTNIDGNFKLAIFPSSFFLRTNPPKGINLAPVSKKIEDISENKHLLMPVYEANMEKAKQYAPIIWLADNERLYPMIPHPFAFDGIDNDSNGLTDLEDPGEVCMDGMKREDLVYLVEEFRGKKRLPPARVGYHIGDKQKNLYNYQYWFYYLFDEGIDGHEHDNEHAFIYVSDDREVKAVVGAGHTSATANNILVVGNDLQLDKRFPTELPKHIPILAELGKHASAPDKDLDGRFDLGVDANIFPDYAWGSRDIMTATDTLRAGAFNQEFSYPRSKKRLFVENSWGYQPYLKDYQDDNQENKVEGSGTYTLFPLDDMEKLYKKLKQVDKNNRQEKKEEIEKWLFQHRFQFWGGKPPDTIKISDAAFTKMIEWTKKTKSKRVPWLHDDYKHPNDIFKLWLFPIVALEFPRIRYEPGGKHGNVIKGFGFRFGNITRFLRRSFLEVQYDYDFTEKETNDISIVYNSIRGGNFGFYGGFGWGNMDLTSWNNTKLKSSLALSGGMFFSWDIGIGKFYHTQLVPRIGLRGEIHGSKHRPPNINPLALQLSVSTIVYSIKSKHPLTYCQ